MATSSPRTTREVGHGKRNAPEGGRKRTQRGKLNRETVDAILEATSIGASFKDAVNAAGVSEKLGYASLEFAEQPEPDVPDERWTLAAELLEGLQRSRAEAKIEAIRHIRDAMPSSWQAAMTWLERRYPNEYARRVVDIGGSETSGPLRVAIDRQEHRGAHRRSPRPDGAPRAGARRAGEDAGRGRPAGGES